MQPTTSAQALTGLQSAQAGAQDPNSILQAQNKAMGVTGAQQTVTGLRGAINNTTKLLTQVAPSVMGRTGGSLVTNAQASRQVANESAPLQTNLNQEGTDYNQANQDLQALQGQAQTAATGIYQGQQDKLSYAQNLYNSLYQKEQDAQAEKDKAAALAEQVREANLSAKTAAGSGGFNLFGGSTPSTPASTATLTGGHTNQDAYNFVQDNILKGGTTNSIRTMINALQKSAANGNTYDQAKLKVINSIQGSHPLLQQVLANQNGATF